MKITLRLFSVVIVILSIGLASCSQNGDQETVEKLQKQVSSIEEDNQQLQSDIKQLQNSVQSLKDKIATEGQNTASSGEKQCLPDDLEEIKKDQLKQAMDQIVSKTFKDDPKTKDWEMKQLKPLSESDTYYQMGVNQCGESVAKQSWLVELHFPDYEPSESASTYQLFIAKSKSNGWKVWFKY